MRHLRLTTLACASLLLPSWLAFAQNAEPAAPVEPNAAPAAENPTPDASRPTPPRLIENVEPVYPE
jgi:hypothetical protein